MADAERTHWIGFDLGGTKMLATVFDAAFKPIGTNRKKTKAHLGLKAGLARTAETIRDALTNAQCDAARIAGIGIGCPGPVDMENGVILAPPNLGWGEAPIRKHLEKEFGCPVVVLNDVDAGVYGEYRFGAAQGVRTALGVFPGTGIGGGCIYDGAILRGSRCSCVEVGHILVLPNGPLCGCGKRGCLEAVASRLAVAASAARSAYRGEAPYLQKAAGTDLSQIRSTVLADAIKAGDEVIERIVKEAARQIGVAVAGVIHLIAPDVVILGGGLVEAMPELFVKGVQAAAKDRVMTAFRDTFKVVSTKLGDDAGVMGAAAWARKSIIGK
ncbi:MAG: ROK family protein [Planctomycetaceae bacterium]